MEMDSYMIQILDLLDNGGLNGINNYAYFFDTLDFVLSGNQTTWANPQWATLFIRKLVQNITFRNKFINRYADEMNTRYLPTNVTSHFIDIYENMYDEMSSHIERWNESEPWVSQETVYQFVDIYE